METLKHVDGRASCKHELELEALNHTHNKGLGVSGNLDGNHVMWML